MEKMNGASEYRNEWRADAPEKYETANQPLFKAACRSSESCAEMSSYFQTNVSGTAFSIFYGVNPRCPGTVLFHLLLADVTFGGKINHLIIGLLEIISVNEALNDLRGCFHLVTVFGFLGWNGNELATAWNWGYSAIFGWDRNHLVAFLDGRLHLP